VTTRAALLTPPGQGGIAVVRMVGPGGASVIEKIFHPYRGVASKVNSGEALQFGKIYDGAEIIDQVIVATDGPGETIDINCHGGPRIIQRLLMLLQKQDIEIAAWGDLLSQDSISDEIAYFLPQAKTKMAALTIAAQEPSGLTGWCRAAIESLNNKTGSLADIRQQIKEIVATRPLAQRLLAGSDVVLAGAVNVGKSTLANALTGKRQSITADMPGTTRDWTVQLTDINGLPINLIDTAGRRDGTDHLERDSLIHADQQLKRAELIVLVISADTDIAGQTEKQRCLLPEKADPLIIINKCDLFCPPDVDNTYIRVSARTGENLPEVRQAIADWLGFADFEPNNPLVFTSRQETILNQTTDAPTIEQAVTNLNFLLGKSMPPIGPISACK